MLVHDVGNSLGITYTFQQKSMQRELG